VQTGLAVSVLWALIVAAGLSMWPRSKVPGEAVATAGLFAALAVLTGLSVLWTPGNEGAITQFNRTTLLLGVFLVGVVASRRGDAASWADGIAIGFTIIGLIALASRCFPDLFPDGELPEFLPSARNRLSYPINYWNALGIGVALVLPLLLRAAVASERAFLRGLWLAPIPALGVTVYLTSSRGGVAVAAAGTLAFLALAGRRLVPVALATVVALIGGLVAIVAVQSHTQLVEGPLDGTVSAAGRAAALEIAAVCAATGIAHLLLSSTHLRRVRLSRGAVGATAMAATLMLIGVAALADVGRRFADFKQPQGFADTERQDFVRAHLLSGGGSGRWQFWSAAVDQWREAPLFGGGAGSYESWWAQNGTLAYFVRNAHSLFAETLGELGLVGLCLLVGIFGVSLSSGAMRLRRADDDGLAVAALTAVIIAFVVGAALDWVWQIPVVAGVGVLALALVTGPSTVGTAVTDGIAKSADVPRHPSRFGVGLAALAACWIMLAIQVVPWLTQREISASQAALARGERAEALDRAGRARRLEPWAASPRLQLALVAEQTDDLDRARRSIADALDRDRRNWRIWVVSARINTRAGRFTEARRDLGSARRLNPRSPLLSSARARSAN